MDIAGNQKIKAPREQVFQAILNPQVLKNSVPGCESAELVDTPIGKQLQLTVAPNFPGFKGPYTVQIRTGEVVAPSRVVLITEPSSSVGTIKAVCTVDLNEDSAGTDLKYNAHADMEGKIASIPEMMLKPAVKGALDHFFKSLEKQLS